MGAELERLARKSMDVDLDSEGFEHIFEAGMFFVGVPGTSPTRVIDVSLPPTLRRVPDDYDPVDRPDEGHGPLDGAPATFAARLRTGSLLPTSDSATESVLGISQPEHLLRVAERDLQEPAAGEPFQDRGGVFRRRRGEERSILENATWIAGDDDTNQALARRRVPQARPRLDQQLGRASTVELDVDGEPRAMTRVRRLRGFGSSSPRRRGRPIPL